MRPKELAMRALATVTVLNVLISLGFAIAGLVRPEAILPAGMAVTGAATTFALYACVRSLVLAGFVISTVMTRDVSRLRLLGSFAALVQLLDAGVGVYQQDLGKIIGPLAVATLQAWVLLRNAGSHRAA